MAKYESGMDEDYDEFAKQTHRFVSKMKMQVKFTLVSASFSRN